MLEAALRGWAELRGGDDDFGAGGGLAAVRSSIAAHGGGGGGGSGSGRALMALRVMLTGADSGCGLGDTLRLLGRDVAETRLRRALAAAAE